MDVAKVADHDHRLVIAEDEVHAAARGAGLSLQAPDGPQDLGHLVATVDDVAVEEEVSVAPLPMAVRIDDANSLQVSEQGGVVPLEIADRQESARHFVASRRDAWWIGIDRHGRELL